MEPTDTASISCSSESGEEKKVFFKSTDDDEALNHSHNLDTLRDIIFGLGQVIGHRKYPDDIIHSQDFEYTFQLKLKHYESNGHRMLKFKYYAPKVFKLLREFYGISEKGFMEIFDLDNLHVSESSGRSEAFFVFSKDRQIVMKTTTKKERDLLRDMLPEYYNV